MNTQELFSLIEKLQGTGYDHIQVEHEGSAVILSNIEVPGTINRENVSTAASASVPTEVQETVAGSAAARAAVTEAASVEAVEETAADENLHEVLSPIVGTFYTASSPDVDPYVQVGDKVKKGDTLCIIEAMKLMNDIEADVNGEVVAILVDNEDGVEYNQPLFKIKVG